MTAEVAKFHRELAGLITEPLLAVAAPREHAKSTNIVTIWHLYELYLQQFHYAIIICDTAAQAESRLAEIISEIESNPLLNEDFGPLKPAIPDKWTDRRIVTSTNTMIEALGVGSKIRGRKHGAHRPDRITFDDIENDENVATPEQRKKLFDWFFRAAINARQVLRSRVRIIGTILHYDSLLSKLLDPEEHRGWTKRLYRAITYDQVGTPHALWPARWGIRELAQRKEEIGSLIFNQEFQNIPASEEDAIIKRSWLKRHDFTNPDDPIVKAMKKYIRIDPAAKANEKSDEFALVVVGMTEEGKFYDLDSFHGKLTFREQVNLFMDYFVKWHEGFQMAFAEDNAYQDVLRQEINAVGAERKLWPPTKGVTTSKDKRSRLIAQSGIIENGLVFLRTGNVDLETQLCDFGSTARDDLMDAFIGCIEGIRAETPAFLSYIKERAKEATKENPQSFLRDFGKQLQPLT